MATRKRTTRPAGIVDRAVSAGRRALREAEKRVPPDLRRQAERGIRDADKTARAAIKALQTQVRRASTRADVNSVLKRIDGLTKQARQVIRGTGPARPTTTAKRTPTRTRKAAATTRRKPASTRKAAAARKPATTRSTTRRAPAPKRRRARAAPADEAVFIAPVEEIEIIEVAPEP